VFDGLFPRRHNHLILNLIWDLCVWHAYAKLRLHTDDTLSFYQEVTSELGASIRKFKDETCSAYHTKELPKETASRGRRTAAEAKKTGHSSSKHAKVFNQGSKLKTFNANTPKLHAHGDYVESISWIGPSDITSTQRVCLFLISRLHLYWLIITLE
jgi:hypothetical protein